MSSKANNDTLMNILKGNIYWNKKEKDNISKEIGNTKQYIMDGTAYTDEAAQKIRAGYGVDGAKAKNSAVASNAADNSGNPDSYAGAQGDAADIAYRSAGEDAVRSRAASSEGGLITSDQNLVTLFGVASGANSTDLAAGMQYNNNLANTEVADKSADLDYKKNSDNNASAEKIAAMQYGTDSEEKNGQTAASGNDKQTAENVASTEEEKVSETNNDTIMNVLKGNVYWNKKEKDNISKEIGNTKQYIMDGTAYTDEAADTIRRSFAAEGGSGENTYGANQKNRTSGAYGAAAENAVIARATQTESNLNASDVNLINALKVATDANSTDLATGMQYNNNLADTEVSEKSADLDYKKNTDNNTSAEKIAVMQQDSQTKTDTGGAVKKDIEGTFAEEAIKGVGKAVASEDDTKGYTDDQLIYAYYTLLSSGEMNSKEVWDHIADESNISVRQFNRVKKQVFNYKNFYATMRHGIYMSPEEFYEALANGDTEKTLGMTTYMDYIGAVKELKEN